MLPTWLLARLGRSSLHTRSVPNTGSAARDHLANERTWLAWTRTSLAFAALGLGLDRFDLLRQDVQAVAGKRHDQPEPKADGSDTRGRLHPYVKEDLGTQDFRAQSRAMVDIVAKPSTLLLGTGIFMSVQSTIRYYRVASALGQNPPAFIPARGAVGVSALLSSSFFVMILYHQLVMRTEAGNP